VGTSLFNVRNICSHYRPPFEESAYNILTDRFADSNRRADIGSPAASQALHGRQDDHRAARLREDSGLWVLQTFRLWSTDAQLRDGRQKYRGDLTSTARPRSNTCRVERRVKLSNGPRLCSPSDLSETHRTAARLSIQTDELVQQTVLLFARRLAGEPRRLRARPTHPIPRWILSK
jgi:hypothetical protein